jgi:hypothetical protein
MPYRAERILSVLESDPNVPDSVKSCIYEYAKNCDRFSSDLSGCRREGDRLRIQDALRAFRKYDWGRMEAAIYLSISLSKGKISNRLLNEVDTLFEARRWTESTLINFEDNEIYSV